MISKDNHNEELQIAERIAYLIAGDIRGTLTHEEGEELDDWISDSEENLALFEKLTGHDYLLAAIAQFNRIEQNKLQALVALKKEIRK